MPQDPRFSRIPGDCEACILATVGGNPRTLCDLRASMLGRRKRTGKEPRLLRLVQMWIKWTGCDPQITAESDHLSREVRACRRQMQLARRQLKRNREEGITEDSPLVTEEDFLSSTIRQSQTMSAEDESDDIFELPDNMEDEDKEDDPEGEIISHYAHSIHTSSTALRRAPVQEDIHPAFRNSTIPSFHGGPARPATPRPPPPTSTSYASMTALGPDRLSSENLEIFNNFPPRPERPQNRSTYMDSMSDLRISQPSAVIPPLRSHQQPAYSESMYSRDIYGRRPRDARSTTTAYARRADEDQTRAYADLMRRREEEYSVERNSQSKNRDYEEELEAPPLPQRSPRRETRWTDFAGRHAAQDGW
ncbi:hypothetical protein EG329_009477 [Mollisiaceae sp. DMI_Dod_QoI]|nr:hypothetical protein EG329_009477 [Helotiales sp. DMI_Dod_QoI]